jgi:hypothetical protein
MASACRYFGGAEVITVPGFTHEVQDYYLDDVLTMVGNPHRANLGSPADDDGPAAAPKAEIISVCNTAPFLATG